MAPSKGLHGDIRDEARHIGLRQQITKDRMKDKPKTVQVIPMSRQLLHWTLNPPPPIKINQGSRNKLERLT